MASYYWQCTECEIGIDVSCPIADRDVIPEESCLCDAPKWERIYEAPMQLKASYLDGQSRGDNYQKLKEATRLEREMQVLPRDKRGDHQKAISKLKKL